MPVVKTSAFRILGAAILSATLTCVDCSTKAPPQRAASVRSGAHLTSAADANHGRVVFAANCQSCHGVGGVGGGVGPSLRGERARKNFAATIVWIRNPQPPMPKLYPAPLSSKDVIDVAAFVQSL